MDVTLLMRVLSMRRVLRRHERWNANQIEAHQTAQLRTLRAHAYTHSRFYRKFHSGSETKPLHELPVLTKSELMSNFDDLVTDPDVHLAGVHAYLEHLQGDDLFRGKYRVTRTAGSTGKPGVFLSDPMEWAMARSGDSRAEGIEGDSPAVTAVEVSPLVNSAKNNGPELFQPAVANHAENMPQRDLFAD